MKTEKIGIKFQGEITLTLEQFARFILQGEVADNPVLAAAVTAADPEALSNGHDKMVMGVLHVGDMVGTSEVVESPPVEAPPTEPDPQPDPPPPPPPPTDPPPVTTGKAAPRKAPAKAAAAPVADPPKATAEIPSEPAMRAHLSRGGAAIGIQETVDLVELHGGARRLAQCDPKTWPAIWAAVEAAIAEAGAS